MTWFRRGGGNNGTHDDPPPPAPLGGEDPADSPEQLLLRQWELVQFINHSAGKLPVEAVVVARDITDTIREVVDTASERDLDVYAIVSINGIIGDYLPTTLRTFLNLDPQLTRKVGPSGRTPQAALLEQLDSLSSAADDLLHATQSHDVDAIFTQGNFLRTKFSGSDLDL